MRKSVMFALFFCLSASASLAAKAGSSAQVSSGETGFPVTTANSASKILAKSAANNGNSAVPSKATAQDLALTLQVEGVTRNYLLHVPAHLPAGKVPLMIVFHGTGGSGEGMVTTTGMNAVADEKGFLVAYPDAVGERWKFIGAHNDVTFVESLLKTLEAERTVDPAQIHISGLSQGGGMVQVLACLHADWFAGAADVAQNINHVIETRCEPSRPMNFVLFHGTKDPVSPFEGGKNAIGGAPTESAQHTAEFWAKINHSGLKPEVTSIEDKLSDGQLVTDTRQVWKNEAQTRVTFFTITGGGHTWPGGVVKRPELGPISQKLNASRLIWESLTQTTVMASAANVAPVMSPSTEGKKMALAQTELWKNKIYILNERSMLTTGYGGPVNDDGRTRALDPAIWGMFVTAMHSSSMELPKGTKVKLVNLRPVNMTGLNEQTPNGFEGTFLVLSGAPEIRFNASFRTSEDFKTPLREKGDVMAIATEVP